MGSEVTWPYVASISSHTGEARGLKFDMHNPYMNGSKVTNQIFDILLIETEVFKFNVLYLRL